MSNSRVGQISTVGMGYHQIHAREIDGAYVALKMRPGPLRWLQIHGNRIVPAGKESVTDDPRTFLSDDYFHFSHNIKRKPITARPATMSQNSPGDREP